ncbi:hypothetical protein NKI19_10980 [Mesorhizobium sp. M0751]|uniref:hypothetical protein n=1 Tax=unclassified Mesorhizobium TaxID=325217 RepID=UPI003337ED86
MPFLLIHGAWHGAWCARRAPASKGLTYAIRVENGKGQHHIGKHLNVLEVRNTVASTLAAAFGTRTAKNTAGLKPRTN